MRERDLIRIYGDDKTKWPEKYSFSKKEDKECGEVDSSFKVSIIITAYNTSEYIEECLDSIEKQKYFIGNDNYEVLVGIDGCVDTLNVVKTIKHKYRNIRVFSMLENYGTYVTTNTLIGLSRYENIIRFDSDDIMDERLICEVKKKQKYDVVLFKCSNFVNKSTKIESLNNIKSYPDGVIFIKRDILNIFGGYMNWKCAADTEFIKRITKHVSIGRIEDAMFYRRVHDKSLTMRDETKLGGKLRENYRKIIDNINANEVIKITPVTGNYIEIL